MTDKDVLKMVLDKLKAEGLDIAEESAGKVVKAVFAGVRDYVTQSENKFDDLALAVLPPVEALVMREIDKIDGQPG